MACVYPFAAFDTGLKSESGKAVFKYEKPGTKYIFLNSLKRKFAFSPIMVKTVEGQPVLADPVPIPCGSCYACLMDKSSELATRAVLEAQYHKHAYFCTLTYRDSCLPISKFTGEAVLIREELINWVKRLRTYIDCRVLACGEYGDITGRPHFHAVVYTDDDFELRQFGVNVYHSGILEKTWKFGLSECSNADTGCMSYVAGYVLKKCKMVADDDPHKPFRYLPRNPGLGMMYLDDHDVLADGKVYGDFGKDCKTRKVPSAFLRKYEGDPRLEQFKDWNKSNGLRFNTMLESFYNTVDTDLLAGLRSQRLGDRIDKSRKEKI